MKTQPEGRAVMLGRYIIENRTTVRGAAKNFGISKSTVHKDVSERLKQEDPELYSQVKDILEINKQERHIRGGLATKRKYAEIACRRKKNIYK
ncbi:sporulation transcriptional regulator SpoIIID [Ruminococcus flavefaciens]|uniref:sporulation transcriptional regulator SpoIIID n=1 Tax=Ruminococcus flavefaciens TaxID=1265 RepID=UPI0026ED42C2|nr:sporulation transcriptional regulator SpoIIID [Ruminococcus flavefaciens]MDD7515251.1 sporulation transcriptional regulator SpoIIID [Ruminococcus flavefaciens]MDY5690291.1 sporulation transcriptional regulator SpoIIID [Ruminococcus flavefaciens]